MTQNFEQMGKPTIANKHMERRDSLPLEIKALFDDRQIKIFCYMLNINANKAHAYVFASRGCIKWDTYGPKAVLEYEGSIATDLRDQHYSYVEAAPDRWRIHSYYQHCLQHLLKLQPQRYAQKKFLLVTHSKVCTEYRTYVQHHKLRCEQILKEQ
uniref:Uncharacterized protein n=1 Tax=Glossina austeni TaxID=7395 RepID=A0A1A9VXS5_GLOAU